MQKRVLGMIGGAVVIVLLVGAVVLLMRTDSSEESSSDTTAATTLSEEEQAALVLSEQEVADVERISISNDTGSYEVVQVTTTATTSSTKETTTTTTAADSTDEDTATTTATTEETVTFRIAGWEDLPTNDSLIGTLANNTASLQAEQCVEEHTEDLDKFGLGDDAVKAELQFKDGSTLAFRVGDSVSGSSSNYFALEDSDTVYTVKTSLLANFSKADTDFLSTTILEEPDEEDMPTIETVTITREDLDTPIILEPRDTSNDNEASSGTQSSHEMISPITAYLSVERSEDVIEGLFGLSASKILTVKPTDSDLQEYGLDDPFAVLTVECDDGNTYTLNIGALVTETSADEDSTGSTTEATTETYYPVQLEGTNLLYAVSEDDCPWATITPTGLASKLIFTTYVWDISNLEVTVDGETTTFENSGTDEDSAAITKNGTSVETERYRLFYSFLLQTAAEEVVLGDAPTGTPDAEIHYQTSNGSEDRTVAFYQVDDFTCYITVDGVLSFQCRSSYLDALRHNLEIFDTDEDFQTTWE